MSPGQTERQRSRAMREDLPLKQLCQGPKGCGFDSTAPLKGPELEAEGHIHTCSCVFRTTNMAAALPALH